MMRQAMQNDEQTMARIILCVFLAMLSGISNCQNYLRNQESNEEAHRETNLWIGGMCGHTQNKNKKKKERNEQTRARASQKE